MSKYTVFNVTTAKTFHIDSEAKNRQQFEKELDYVFSYICAKVSSVEELDALKCILKSNLESLGIAYGEPYDIDEHWMFNFLDWVVEQEFPNYNYTDSAINIHWELINRNSYEILQENEDDKED